MIRFFGFLDVSWSNWGRQLNTTCEGEGDVGLGLIFEKLHIEIVNFNN